MSNEMIHQGISRRNFLKTTAAVAGAAAASGSMVACSSVPADKAAAANEQVFVCNCRNNCHWHCAHDVTVRDGIVVNAAMHPFPEEVYSSICQRGISLVQRMYSPLRIKYPMRRKEGTERGAGQWERISWDEAIKEVAEKFCYYRDTFGGSSIVKGTGGNVSFLFSMVPGILASNVGMSTQDVLADYNGGHAPQRVLGTGIGGFDFCNEPRSVLEAKLVIFWGGNTAVTMPQLWRMDMLAKEAGAKLISIDPVRSVTSQKCNQYIPIRPASDLYLALAISNYLLQNALYDKEFVSNRTTAPFLVNKATGAMYTELEDPSTRTAEDYFVYDPTAGAPVRFGEAVGFELEWSGDIDDTPVETVFSMLKKHLAEYTVAKAVEMCQIPEETIMGLISDMVNIKPCTIHCAYGTDHYNNGFESISAMLVLQALLGNYGRPGAGFAGIFVGAPALNYGPFFALNNYAAPGPTITVKDLPEAFATQSYKGQPVTLKAMLSIGDDAFSNAGDARTYLEKQIPNMEYWVVIERAWSDAANYADLVLPCAEYYETCDIRAAQALPFVSMSDAAVEPSYESKTDWQILALIGRAMGYESDWPEESITDPYYWAKKLLDKSVTGDTVSFETMKREHVVRGVGENGGPALSQGYNWNPNFGTKSGRLELYWEDPVTRFDYGQNITEEDIRKVRMVSWIEPDEAWPTNPQYKKYPLVLLTLRSRFRTHSQHFENPLFLEIEPEPYVRMCHEDLETRGLKDGDYVEVYNDRGNVVVKAIEDPAYAPGVICIPKGWKRHQFKVGGYQDLTSRVTDKWGVGGPFYDCLVEVRKWNA